MLRVLKLYVVVNDNHLYELMEQQPLVLDEHQLPVKLVVKNGFHLSKPFHIRKYHAENILIGIGCEVDNGRLWGGIIFSLLFFIIFAATGLYIMLLLANLPLLYLVYKFFLKPAEFITIERLKK